MSAYADATRARAAELDHAWDRRAIDWPGLGSTSVVVEVGGYIGRWALQIAERYQPQLYVFEPQLWARDVCREVLAPYPSAWVFGVALGTHDHNATMGEWETDGCSLVKDGAQIVAMHEIGRFFEELRLTRIDLMLMNIEGYEYTLLSHMLDRGLMPDRLMVQWHLFADVEGRQQAIIDQIEQTHDRLWDYGNVLMAWGRR